MFSRFCMFFYYANVWKCLTSAVVTANKTSFFHRRRVDCCRFCLLYYYCIVSTFISFYFLSWWLNILFKQTNRRVDFRSLFAVRRIKYIFGRAARFVLATFSRTDVCIVIIIIIIILPVSFPVIYIIKHNGILRNCLLPRVFKWYSRHSFVTFV